MKLQKRYTDDEKLLQILSGTSYAFFCANDDLKNLEKYKRKLLSQKGFKENLEMEILLLLEKLGFPMDELGTYLYKNLIVYIVSNIENISKRQDILNTKYLLFAIKDAFSNVYLNLARYDLEMGVKKFHCFIMKALNKIDNEKADKALIEAIYGRIPFETDYAEQAFILGCYFAGKYEKIDTQDNELEQIEYPKVKELGNMPKVK